MHGNDFTSCVVVSNSSVKGFHFPDPEAHGLVCSGQSPDGKLVEFIELPDHPFWVGTQAHPEFKSRPNRPAPLFRGLVGAALDRSEGRNPQLIPTDDKEDAQPSRSSS